MIDILYSALGLLGIVVGAFLFVAIVELLILLVVLKLGFARRILNYLTEVFNDLGSGFPKGW